MVENLAADAFDAAARHLGRREARRLFAKVAKKASEGRQADQTRNRELLREYDDELRKSPENLKSIPRLVACRGIQKTPAPWLRLKSEFADW